MNALYQAEWEVHRFFQERDWAYCVIGGLAVLRWGRPRTTQDVDISLRVPLGEEETYVGPLLDRFSERIPEAHRFALENRVVLARASVFAVQAGVSCITASAEDLIVLKAIAGRGQDWVDVEGIAVRQSDRLDWGAVRERLEALCELTEDLAPLARLDRIRRNA